MRANDTQVGGSHYRAKGEKVQHWDLAIMFNWDPFQYQITKYIMRWKDKHSTPQKRLEDLMKARHFLDKYIENFEAYDVQATAAPAPVQPHGQQARSGARSGAQDGPPLPPATLTLP